MSAMTHGEDSMDTTTAPAARTRRRTGPGGRGRLSRSLIMALLGALIAPLLLFAAAPAAFAAGCGGSAEDEECKNYSFYQLASNASTYFGEKNSPDAGDGFSDEWTEVTSSPASGGSLLGYADPEFSLGNIIGWFFAEVSGSSQTVTYDTLKAVDSDNSDEADSFSGMLDYAHFGAANRDLGLDTMSSGIGGEIVAVLGGSIMWAMYALALFISMAFGAIIMLLKMLNPFMWFGEGVKAVNATFGEGMVAGGDSTVADGPLSGLVSWISDWYQLLNGIAWEALVPLFIGFTLLALVMFKKMDRGSLLKKLLVRVVFIGVGLPLIGSMYTGVLDKFDDLGVASAGPTRVVLSTYVDFESWMNRDRLAVPDGATIGWDGDQASSESMMSVRTSALAINKQSHPVAYANIGVGTKQGSAAAAWKNGQVNVTDENDGDTTSVFTTFGLLNRYITSQTMAASDFESGMKTSITRLDVDDSDKEDWFVNKKSYGDAKDFGDEDGPKPPDHPVISTQAETGLTSSRPGADKTSFGTKGVADNCGFSVYSDDAPAACNLAPLAAYNYMNTRFDSSSLTMFSSNNATSGFTRENHMATAQVGTGPAKFMYWSNSVTLLACLVLLGFWYAIGMLVGSVKRTFSLMAAVPFATLGAIAAIAKVIVYSLALILEVIVTLFLYSFVSEFLIGIPGIISGPVSDLVAGDGLFGSTVLGGIVVAILTLFSTLLVIGVTFALLRVRKVVLQAMDEVFTKLVDKFLDTNTAPRPDKGGMLPALAAGAGAGAGMAMGNKMASGLGGKLGGMTSPKSGGQSRSKIASTNAGGLNPNGAKALEGKGPLALEAGDHRGGGGDGPDGPDAGGTGGRGPGGSDGGKGSEGADGRKAQGSGSEEKGGPLQLAKGRSGELRSDKATAQGLSARGGLSKLGYESGALGDKAGKPGSGSSMQGDQASGQPGQPGAPGSEGSSRSGSGTSGGRKELSSSSKGTQFGTGSGKAIEGEVVGGSAGMSQKGTVHGSRPIQGGGAQNGSLAPGQQAPAQGARFTAGTRGSADLNPGRAGIPAAQETPGTQGSRGSSSAPSASGAPVAQGKRGTTGPSPATSGAPRTQGRPVPVTQVPIAGKSDQAANRLGGVQPGRAPVKGAAGTGGGQRAGVPQAVPRPAPTQQRQALPASQQRSQGATTAPRPSTRQGSTVSPSPQALGRQAPSRPAPSQKAPSAASPQAPVPKPAQVSRRAALPQAQASPKPTAPAKPRRASEPPKGGDGPISHRDPKGSGE